MPLKYHIDKNKNNRISGWVFEEDDPSITRNIILQINDKIVDTQQANILRKNLVNKTHPTGKCGFSFHLQRQRIPSNIKLIEEQSKEVIIDLNLNGYKKILFLGYEFGKVKEIAINLQRAIQDSQIFFEEIDMLKTSKEKNFFLNRAIGIKRDTILVLTHNKINNSTTQFQKIDFDIIFFINIPFKELSTIFLSQVSEKSDLYELNHINKFLSDTIKNNQAIIEEIFLKDISEDKLIAYYQQLKDFFGDKLVEINSSDYNLAEILDKVENS